MTNIHSLCLELTQKCPLLCVHCSANASYGNETFLPSEDIIRALMEVGNIEEIYLSGGEPFEHPDFLSIVAAAAKMSGVVVAYSSGTSIDRDRIVQPIGRATISEAMNAGLDRIDLSIYSSIESQHDAITGIIGSQACTVGTANIVREVGLALGIHYVPMGDAWNQVQHVAQMATVLEASRFHVLALTSQGRAQTRMAHLRPPPEFLEELNQVRKAVWPYEIILSSELRKALGDTAPTSRDLLRSVFLDVRGYLYPGEGQRRRNLRTRSSILDGVPVGDLVEQLIFE